MEFIAAHCARLRGLAVALHFVDDIKCRGKSVKEKEKM